MENSGKSLFGVLIILVFVMSCKPKWSESEKDGIKIVVNENGKTLGYAAGSGLELISDDKIIYSKSISNDSSNGNKSNSTLKLMNSMLSCLINSFDSQFKFVGDSVG